MCPCGGVLEIAELTSGRFRMKCLSCGRYEIFQRYRVSPDRQRQSPSGD